jgi:hypothetical protein
MVVMKLCKASVKVEGMSEELEKVAFRGTDAFGATQISVDPKTGMQFLATFSGKERLQVASCH